MSFSPGMKSRRRSLSGESIVRAAPLHGDSSLPLLMEPTVPGVDLVSWAVANREMIESRLLQDGAILFRGFEVAGVDAFERAVSSVSGELLEYTYASTPRTKISGRIYTSTEYPAHQTIPQHNEMSYSRQWPMRLWFYCATAPQDGGETPISDSRRVCAEIDPAIRDDFARRGVMYVRSFGRGLDLTWQAVFQATSKDDVEEACRKTGIDFEWTGDRLTTRQVCQAVARHPDTGEAVWFNQAHLFHESSLPPEVRKYLREAGGELPRNAYYGDGAPIEDDVLNHIRLALDRHTVQFPWMANDVLMMDNMLAAHGRRPFRGPRKILVGMAVPFSAAAVPQSV